MTDRNHGSFTVPKLSSKVSNITDSLIGSSFIFNWKYNPQMAFKNKTLILQNMKEKFDDSTFIAVQIKPNLALLRHKGFYEVQKAQECIQVSLLRNNKQTSPTQDKTMSRIKQSFLSKNSPDLIQISKDLVNQSQRSIHKGEELTSQRRVQDFLPPKIQQTRSRDYKIDVQQLLRKISPKRQEVTTRQLSSPRKYSVTPINMKFYLKIKKSLKNNRLNKTANETKNKTIDDTCELPQIQYHYSKRLSHYE